MINMWSEKKSINTIINILIFLVAINFMHIGQLILPVICLILFVDNKFKLKINNWFIFVILCLFAITFCLFSYKLGFYCVMGFCLPMAYYIGSNINANEDNIKKLIYIIAFGMASHLVINFIFESFLFNFDYYRIFNKVTHYDIWLSIRVAINNIDIYKNGSIKTTAMSIRYIFILACSYYIFKYEKNKKFKYIGLLLFALSSVYCLALGRRTTLILFFVVLLFSKCFDMLFISKTANVKKVFVVVLAVLILLMMLYLFIQYNVFNLKDMLYKYQMFYRIFNQGFNSGRTEVMLDSFEYYSQYLWGGKHISEVLGLQIHNLWGDIYDYAGIIPFVLIVVYSFYYFVVGIKVINTSGISKNIKMMIINIFVCSFVVMLLEPLMTGSSLILMIIILIISAIDKNIHLV